jgi:hypothetical protein
MSSHGFDFKKAEYGGYSGALIGVGMALQSGGGITGGLRKLGGWAFKGVQLAKNTWKAANMLGNSLETAEHLKNGTHPSQYDNAGNLFDASIKSGTVLEDIGEGMTAAGIASLMTIKDDEPLDTRQWGREALVGGVTAWAGAAGRNSHFLPGSYWGNMAGNEWGQKAALKLGLQDGFDWGEVRDAGKSGVIGDAFGMALSVVGAAGSIVAKVGGSAAKMAAKGAVKVAGKAAGAGLRGVGSVLKKVGLEGAISDFVHGTMKDSILHDPLTRLGRKMGLKVCFAAGTPLRTPTGSQLIETFQVGDLILSRDEHDAQGVITSQQVEEVFERQGLVWNLHVGGQVLRTTAEHPFYVLGQGWTACHELQAGHQLLCEDGSTITVESLVDSGEWETVYNLTVSELHTYFVGCSEWGFAVWAHNAECALIQDGENFILKNSEDGKILAQGKEVAVRKFAKANGHSITSENVTGTLEREVDHGVLGSRIEGGIPEDHTPHHLIGIKEAGQFPVMEKAAELGYDVNRGNNLIALPNTEALAKELDMPYHPGNGRHTIKTYVDPVRQRLTDLQRRFDAGLVDESSLLSEIGKVEDGIRANLLDGSLRLNSKYPWYKSGL